MVSWSSLKMSSDGQKDVRHILETSKRAGLYRDHKAKMDTADRSILVQGANTDNSHLDTKGFWHPWWQQVRDTEGKDQLDFTAKLTDDMFDFVSCSMTQ